MNGLLKTLLITTGALFAFGGITRMKAALKAKKVADQLNIDIRDFTLSPIGFNLVLANQTNEALTITKPVVELFLNDSSVAYSAPGTDQYTIDPFETQKIRISFKTRQTALALIAKAAASMLKGYRVTARYTLYAIGIFVTDEKKIA